MIFVDDAFIPKGRSKWCHLVSDTSFEELQNFARRIGLRDDWFQLKSWPHYDVTETVRLVAIRQGAQICEYRDILNHNYAFIERLKQRQGIGG